MNDWYPAAGGGAGEAARPRQSMTVAVSISEPSASLTRVGERISQAAPQRMTSVPPGCRSAPAANRRVASRSRSAEIVA